MDDDELIRNLIDIQNQNLAELRRIREEIGGDYVIENRSPGLATGRARARRAQESTGSFERDLFREFADIGVPDPEYAQSLFSFNQNPNSIWRKGYLASGAAQRAGRVTVYNVQEDRMEQRADRAYVPEGRPTTIPVEKSERAAHARIAGLAREAGIKPNEFEEMMRGQRDISQLESIVRSSGEGRDVQRQMDRIVAGRGMRGNIYTAGRVYDTYMPYAQATVEAIGKSIQTIDRAYTYQTQGAGMGYGFNLNMVGGGASEMATRQFQAFGTSLRPGLTRAQVQEIRNTIEASGYGQAGQEYAYDQIFSAMSDITQQTGGRLSASSQMQVAEMFLRSGRAADSMQDLVKLLSEDLPAAANSSRMSLEGMHSMLMNTTQQLQSNFFMGSSLTGAQIYERTATAMSSGAQPAEGMLMGGANDMLSYRAAGLANMNVDAFQQSPTAPFYRGMAIDELISQYFRRPDGTPMSKSEIIAFQGQNPTEFLSRSKLLGLFGITPDILKSHLSQDNSKVLAAIGLQNMAQAGTQVDAGVTSYSALGTENSFVTGAVKTAGIVEGATFGALAAPPLAVFGSLEGLINKASGGAWDKTRLGQFIDIPNPWDFGESISGGLQELFGDTKTTGEQISVPWINEGRPFDPNKKGTASYLLQGKNKEIMDTLRQNLTNEQRSKIDSLVSGGTYNELRDYLNTEGEKIAQGAAGEASKGGTQEVRISLDPNNAAYNLFNIENNNTVAKEISVFGNSQTQPGSIFERSVTRTY